MSSAIRPPARCPARELRAGLAEHPAAERHDQARGLGDADELAGRHEPALGVRPAHERLDAGRAAGAERHLRLVVQHQLVPLERAVQLVLQGEPAARVAQRGVVVDLAAAAPLGGAQRGGGLAQHALGVAARAGLGDADRRPDVMVAAGERERRGERGERAGGDRAGVRVRGQPSHRSANSSPPSRATVSEGRMTARRRAATSISTPSWSSVADEREAVDAEQQHRERAAAAREAGEGLAEAVGEEGAVRQAGERVVQRDVGERQLGGRVRVVVEQQDADPRSGHAQVIGRKRRACIPRTGEPARPGDPQPRASRGHARARP